MNGIITRNVSIADTGAAAPLVEVQVRADHCQPLELFCREHGVTPLQFLPVGAGRFVGVFAPTVYNRPT